MRKVVFNCAMSLDGYIAGTGGTYDWIVMDKEIDFSALTARFDTAVMGRKTYETMIGMGQEAVAGVENVVVSRTLPVGARGAVTVAGDGEVAVRVLRDKPGKDIWLFGGGELLRCLLAAGLVDQIEVSIMPVMLGGGIPLLSAMAERVGLRLVEHRVYAASGIVGLTYAVVGRTG